MLENLQNIGIRFDTKDLERWIKAVKNVEIRTPVVIDEMQRQCAILLSQNIYSAIHTGKYTYHDYDIRYKKWKTKYYPNKKWWELKGDLAKNLKAFAVSKSGTESTWAAGVPDGIMDVRGKSWNEVTGDGTQVFHGKEGVSKEISWYGAINESQRPLFVPETKEFANGEWQKYSQNALSRIKNEWR